MKHDSDHWDAEAKTRLQAHVMRGTTAGRNYAPDSNYEDLKRGVCAPHSLAIAQVFVRWAHMWAQDMREYPDGDAQAQWDRNMREADAEVDRYLDANKLPRAA